MRATLPWRLVSFLWFSLLIGCPLKFHLPFLVSKLLPATPETMVIAILSDQHEE